MDSALRRCVYSKFPTLFETSLRGAWEDKNGKEEGLSDNPFQTRKLWSERPRISRKSRVERVFLL